MEGLWVKATVSFWFYTSAIKVSEILGVHILLLEV